LREKYANKSGVVRKMLRRVLWGALILPVLIVFACAAPSSVDISGELPVKNEALTVSPKAASLSASVPVTCQVAGLAISPVKVNPGEKATITAYIMNTGDDEVSYIAELEINKVVVQVTEVVYTCRTDEVHKFPSVQG